MTFGTVFFIGMLKILAIAVVFELCVLAYKKLRGKEN